jgi:hypothetical protein
MGEYAIRVSDNERVKIGTCEDMYYLRFEDRGKVLHLPGNVDPANDKDASQIRFRLPFADEDGVAIGEYDKYDRGERLWKKIPNPLPGGMTCEEFSDDTTASDPGTVQLSHPCGLLVNVPCYHGEKLPESSNDVRVAWNGRSWFLELYQLRPVLEDGQLRVYPVIHCRFCGHLWRYQWADVMEWIPEPMRSRLAVYAPK